MMWRAGNVRSVPYLRYYHTYWRKELGRRVCCLSVLSVSLRNCGRRVCCLSVLSVSLRIIYVPVYYRVVYTIEPSACICELCTSWLL